MALKIKFIKDYGAKDIEITIKASEKSAEVDKIIAFIEKENKSVLVCDSLIKGERIDLSEVVIITRGGRYTTVKTLTDEYVLNEPLYKIEEKLDKDLFVRISQSEIVNLRYVERWAFDGGGIIRIELVGGVRSYTSRRYAVEIKKVLKKGGGRQ